jgi:hypothetical protein
MVLSIFPFFADFFFVGEEADLAKENLSAG